MIPLIYHLLLSPILKATGPISKAPQLLYKRHCSSTPTLGFNHRLSLSIQPIFAVGSGVGSLPGFLPRSCLTHYYAGIQPGSSRASDVPPRLLGLGSPPWPCYPTALAHVEGKPNSSAQDLWLRGGNGART